MGNDSHYVDATELRHELIQCDGGDIGARLGEMLLLISKGVASTFRNIPGEEEDLVQDSVLHMMFVIKAKKVDLTRPPSAVFSYFSQLAFNHCKFFYRTSRNYERGLKNMAMEMFANEMKNQPTN